MKRHILILSLLLSLLSSPIALAQKNVLKSKISTIAKRINGQVGVAIMDLTTKDTLLYNVDGIFPMQSVYKFPLALAVLDKIDQKKLSLDQKIKLTKKNSCPIPGVHLRKSMARVTYRYH